jgi:serine/threonine-protein kinase
MTARISRLRPALLTACLLASMTFAPLAHADVESDKAGAQAAFDMGKRLMVEGKYVEACPKLAESVRLDPGVGAMLFLADCYERTGRTASAWAVFREAESLGAKQGDNRVRVAKERADVLEPKLSKLVIVLAPAEAALAGVKVRRDGADVGQALWGSPIPTDPGTHEIIVTAPGKKAWKGSVQIASNAATETVTVPALEDGPSEVEPKAGNGGNGVVTGPPAEPEGSDGSSQRTIGIVVGVGGLALVGLGAGFGLSAKSSLDDSNADNHCRADNKCDATGVAARDDAKSAALISTIGFIAGGAALIGGTVLYFTAPKRSSKAAFRVVPSGGPSSAGLMLHATW